MGIAPIVACLRETQQARDEQRTRFFLPAETATKQVRLGMFSRSPAGIGDHRHDFRAGDRSLGGAVRYAQTKAATTSFVKWLAKQLASKGIRVNGVAPGPIWRALQVSGGATQEKLKQFGGQTPMGRPGQPAELASIYVQLAASDASYATGQVYGAAGGSGQP